MNVNLACGRVYVADSNWINLDFVSTSPAVKQANLLSKLPFNDSSVDFLYSSHFLEHVPRRLVQPFLSECYRVLKPGGVIRLVVPDLEEICKSYLFYRENNEHTKADFLVLELLDQCVRSNRGGELSLYYKSLATLDPDCSDALFVHTRTGHLISPSPPSKKSLSTNISRIPALFTRTWTRIIVSLLPPAFRQQNVSFTSVGERHQWVYDFYSLEKLLSSVGFIQIERKSGYTSKDISFPFTPLDVNQNGTLRKGVSSLFIEACK